MTPIVLPSEGNPHGRYLLEHRGYAAVPRLDGRGGTAWAASAPLGLVPMDTQLPGMDGYMEKPIDPQTFVADIAALINVTGGGAAP